MNFGNLALIILRGLEVIAGWWVLFYLSNAPRSKARRIALLIAIPVLYLLWYLLPIDVWFASQIGIGKIISGSTGNEILWVLILIVLAFISGNLQNSIIDVLWYAGIEQNVDVLRSWANCLIHKGWYFHNYPQYNIEYLLILGWTIFYYMNKRKIRGNVPIAFQIQTVIIPIITCVFLTHHADMIRFTTVPGSELKMDIMIDGLIIGVIVLAINLLMYYVNLKLLLMYNARSLAIEAAGEPPLWTKSAGFSHDFIEKYNLSKRECEIVEAILSGKTTYKELAVTLNLSAKTVANHLRNIYRKTGVFNMVALYTLIQNK